MKIEEYLSSLPQNIISGEDVELPDSALREIFDFIELGKEDVFYHLGCGYGRGIEIAANQYNVKKAIGIDIEQEKIFHATKKNIKNAELVRDNITNQEYHDATVILFWFTEEKIIETMMKKFQNLKPNCKIITVWDPLPAIKPSFVKFPYIVHSTPLKEIENLQEQVLSIFGVKCIDFVTAWEYAERYTKAVGNPETKNDRFLTIMQCLVIWINAKNLGITCGDETPESIKTYITILKEFFDIEVEHLLKK